MSQSILDLPANKITSLPLYVCSLNSLHLSYVTVVLDADLTYINLEVAVMAQALAATWMGHDLASQGNQPFNYPESISVSCHSCFSHWELY